MHGNWDSRPPRHFPPRAQGTQAKGLIDLVDRTNITQTFHDWSNVTGIDSGFMEALCDVKPELRLVQHHEEQSRHKVKHLLQCLIVSHHVWTARSFAMPGRLSK